MNVQVETDLLKNGATKVNSAFADNEEAFNKVNSIATGSCTSLANFKTILVSKFNEYNMHKTIICNKLNECADNLIDIDNLIGNNVSTTLANADSLEFTSIKSQAVVYSTINNSTLSTNALNIEPGVHILDYTLSDGNTMQYVVRVPEDATENMPVIFWTHGANQGQAENVQNMGPIKAAEELGENRFIIFEPVITGYLNNDMMTVVDTFIDEVQQDYKFDTNRIILSGFSMGGAGTWTMGNNNPDKYAAIAPASYGVYSAAVENLKNSNLPIYAMAGGAEYDYCSKNDAIINELKELNPNRDVVSVSVGNLGHYNFYKEGYTQDFFDWCFKQNRINNN